jgi:hypothetical protein
MRHHENECPKGSQDSIKCIHRQQKLADIAVGHKLKDRNPRPTLSSKHQQISTPTCQHISQVSHQLQKKAQLWGVSISIGEHGLFTTHCGMRDLKHKHFSI